MAEKKKKSLYANRLVSVKYTLCKKIVGVLLVWLSLSARLR